MCADFRLQTLGVPKSQEGVSIIAPLDWRTIGPTITESSSGWVCSPRISLKRSSPTKRLCSSTAARTRARVTSPIFAAATRLSTNETVLRDTPASRATSRRVGHFFHTRRRISNMGTTARVRAVGEGVAPRESSRRALLTNRRSDCEFALGRVRRSYAGRTSRRGRGACAHPSR